MHGVGKSSTANWPTPTTNAYTVQNLVEVSALSTGD